jgi:hypothetical protein
MKNTEKEYLEAQKIVDAYKEQLRIADVMRSKLLQEEREKKYKWCEENGGHEYRSSGGKWGLGEEADLKALKYQICTTLN